MNDKNKKLIKNILYLFSGTNISAILMLINTSLQVNIIGLELNGIIFLALTYISIFNIIFNFQSYTALIKFLPKANNKKEVVSYINQGLFFDIITAIIAFFSSFIFLNYISEYLNWSDNVDSTIRILNFSILFTIYGTFDAILRFYGDFKKVVYISISTALFNTICLILGFYLKFGYYYYVYVTLFSVLIRFIISFYYFYKVAERERFKSGLFTGIKLNKEMLKFNLLTNASLVVDVPVVQFTPIFISQYLGVSDLAVYKILEKLGNVFSQISSVASQVIAPEISKKIANNEIIKVKRISFISGLILFFIGLIIIFILFLCKNYWLYFFINNWKEYESVIFLFLFFSVYKMLFFSQYYLFIFMGFEKATVYILIVVNVIYLILLKYMMVKYKLMGVVLLLILQATFIFFIKWLLIRIKTKGLK